MSFKYRVKRYTDEQGEYSDYEECEKDTVLSTIESHWTNDSMPNNLHVISIQNSLGHSLLLEHFNKDVFDVYFLPMEKGLHFHKKSKSGIIYDCLELFMSNQIGELEESLNKTKKDDKFIREEFFFIDHNYRLINSRNNNELLWLIWSLPIGLMLTFLGGLSFMLPIQFFLVPLALVAVGTYNWLPGLLLHIQYKNDTKDFVIRITKGSKLITIKSLHNTRTINKSEIESVTKFQNPVFKNPWNEYGYTEIVFKNGEVINLTNLTVDQWSMLDKFSNDGIETKTINRRIPRLRKRSTVK